MTRKRSEYRGFVAKHFGGGGVFRTDKDKQTLRDILVDCPRTCPGMPVFHTDFIQRSLERVLYIWAQRHPASGYVQGINDIVTPFYTVMLSEHGIGHDCKDLTATGITEKTLMEVEADVYACLTKLLDNYQDHYTFSQPGIQRMVFKLQELVHRLDEKLATHLESVGVQWMHVTFRWMNCLLLRELPHHLVIRLWDSLLCEEDGFETFHVYVCASLFIKFSSDVVGLSFQEVVLFTQRLPNLLARWARRDVEELLGQAFVYKSLYESAPRHLQ